MFLGGSESLAHSGAGALSTWRAISKPADIFDLARAVLACKVFLQFFESVANIETWEHVVNGFLDSFEQVGHTGSLAGKLSGGGTY